MVLTPESWEAIFFDDDGEVDGLEIMDGIIFNPVFLASTIFVDDGEGFLQVSLGGYAVDIGFRIGIPN